MHQFRYTRLWLGIGVFGVALLIVLSLLPVMFELPFSNGDKFGHLLAYAVLAGWFAQLLSSRWLLLLCACGLIVLGVSLEFLQQLTGRYFEYRDMLANSIGVAIGMLAGSAVGARVLLKLERRLSM